jgi:hypothetical protein
MPTWAEERRYVLNAGFDVADGRDFYRPGGYPRIGLAPLSTELSQRSTSLLEKQLLRAERDRGRHLVVRGLSRINPSFANELVSVYLGLAERYPGVHVGAIDFCTTRPLMSAIAIVNDSMTYWPTLHRAAHEIDSGDLLTVQEHLSRAPRSIIAAAKKETANLGRYRLTMDLRAHGIISLGAWTSQTRSYGVFASMPPARNARTAPYSNIPRYLPCLVPEGSNTLVHEFGHVVEDALYHLGTDAEEHVFDAMERALLRRPNGRLVIDAATLREAGLSRADTHLVNYPRAMRRDGVGDSRAAVIKVVGGVVRHAITNYAGVNRDELFAEMFSYAHTAKDREKRAQFAPMLEALHDVGLSVKRRRV